MSLESETRRGGARAWLRDATAEVHEALHHLPAFEALLEGRLSLPEYGRMLHGLAAYHGASREICAAADVALGIEPAGAMGRARVARIADDLVAIGLDPAVAAARVPSADPAWNIGYAYVVAGSAIGGQMLHRALARLFGQGAEGRSFFALSPEERVLWRRFCVLMDTAVGDQDLPRAERGAHAAFSSFRATMDHSERALA